MLKKVICMCIILILCSNFVCFADDKIEEEKPSEVKKVIQTSSNITKEPKINSRAAIILDRNSKSIIYGKNEKTKRPMASTTKIMTALVVIQNANLDDIVEVSKKAASTGGSRLGLKKGDKISINDLLYGLLLRSGNDSAVALAECIGGSVEGFANLMNQTANQLGLNNTHFVTPHGLDSQEHYTTAYELALLTDYALCNKTFAQIVNTKTYTITINGYSKSLNNTNELLGNLNGVYGVKTGFTNGAGRCLVTSIKRDNLDIICVVLGADTKKDRTRDSVKLIEYVFNNYFEINLDEKVKEEFYNWNKINSSRINIEKGITNELNLVLDNKNTTLTYPILKGAEEDIAINITANLNLKAPIKKNTQIGELCILYKNETIKVIPIINTNSINKKGMINYIYDFISDYSIYLHHILET